MATRRGLSLLASRYTLRTSPSSAPSSLLIPSSSLSTPLSSFSTSSQSCFLPKAPPKEYKSKHFNTVDVELDEFVEIPKDLYDDRFNYNINVNELDSARIAQCLRKSFRKLDETWTISDDGLGERGFYHDRLHFPSGKCAVPCHPVDGALRAIVIDFESDCVYPVEKFTNGEVIRHPNIATGPGNQTIVREVEEDDIDRAQLDTHEEDLKAPETRVTVKTRQPKEKRRKKRYVRPTYNDFVQLRKCTFPLPRTLPFNPISKNVVTQE